MTRSSRLNLASLGVTLVYFVTSLYRSLRHVPWADEWAVWLTSKMQSSMGDVVQAVRYDGHPPLWYMLLHGLSRLYGRPQIAEVVHVAIASSTVFVVCRYAPFSWAEKLLLPLGYFFFFEYSTITRSYAPSILCAVIAAALFSYSSRRPVWYALLLLVVGQWSIYGMVLSLALAVGAALQWKGREWPRHWIAAAAVMALSLGLFYVSTRPPADSNGRDLWMNDWRHMDPAKASASLFDAYVPLPRITTHWWNSQLVPLPNAARGMLGLVLLLAAAVRYCRTPAAKAVLLCGTIAILAIVLMIYTGSMRHWGHAFVVLVLAVWIERNSRGVQQRTIGDWAFAGLLVVQAAGGLMAATLDLRQPFSSSPQAAAVLRSAGTTLPVLGDFDYSLVPLAGELDRPMHFIRSNAPGWFVRYDTRRKRNVTMKMIEEQSHELAERENSDVLLVMSYAVALPSYFEKVAEISPTTVADEGYLIYRYRRHAPATKE